MKPIWLWIALLLSVGVNLGVLATIGASRLREPTPWPWMGRPESPPLARAADRLGLEGDTREAFLRIQTEFFERLQASREEMADLEHRLRRELMAATPDPSAVEMLIGEIGSAHARMSHVFADNVLQTRQILDPEQERRYLHFLERLRRAGRPGPRWPEGRRRPPEDRGPRDP